MTGLGGGKNPKREAVVESHSCAQDAQGWGTLGHHLVQEPGRLGPWQRATLATSLSADLKLLAQSQALHLIRRPDTDAVDFFRRLQQSHVRQTRDNLAVFNEKRHLMRSDFQDRASPRKVAHTVTEARVKETG